MWRAALVLSVVLQFVTDHFDTLITLRNNNNNNNTQSTIILDGDDNSDNNNNNQDHDTNNDHDNKTQSDNDPQNNEKDGAKGEMVVVVPLDPVTAIAAAVSDLATMASSRRDSIQRAAEVAEIENKEGGRTLTPQWHLVVGIVYNVQWR